MSNSQTDIKSVDQAGWEEALNIFYYNFLKQVKLQDVICDEASAGRTETSLQGSKAGGRFILRVCVVKSKTNI